MQLFDVCFSMSIKNWFVKPVLNENLRGKGFDNVHTAQLFFKRLLALLVMQNIPKS